MKVLIIGLDGATWNVLDDYLLRNHMPNLNKLKKEGCCGLLRSTEPPSSPVAWTSFLTGCNPGKHGVTGFHYYSFKDNTLGIQNSTHCLVPNMYQLLSKQGYKIISINVPWTYPCYPVNGILVAGMGFGGHESNFTYPADFKDKLLAKMPTYDFRSKTVRTKTGQVDIKRDVIEIQKSILQRTEAVKMASEKIDWDLLAVQYHDTDSMNHQLWNFIATDSRDKYPEYRDETFKAFETLDESIGQLIDMAKEKDAAILVMSDHGGDRQTGRIKANLLLKKWGYLKTTSKWEKWLTKTVKKVKKALGIYAKKSPVYTFDQINPDKLGINLKKSKAYVTHTVLPAGHLYLNIKGRQPTGTVKPGAESERIIEDLRRKSLSAKDPSGNPLFERVLTPSELYGPNIKASERIGDLILIARQGYDISCSCAKRNGPFHLLPEEIPLGTHHPDGICIILSPGVTNSSDLKANIIDIAPTVYALLGAKLPRYMDGKVIQEAFSTPLDIQYTEEDDNIEGFKQEKFEFSKSEEEEVNKHLKELGYI